jgi:outer membrane murein-binding lipoprotein Lpp
MAKNLNEYAKRFSQINSYNPANPPENLREYSFWTGSNIDEAGDEMGAEDPAAADPNAAGGAPPQGGGGQTPTDGAPASDLPQDGTPAADPNAAGGAPPAPGADAGMGDPNADPNAGDPGLEGGDMEVEDIPMDDGGEDIEVDVTELTDKQDETATQIQQLNAKFDQLDKFGEKILQAVDRIIKKSEEEEAEIANVKDEIIKRAPTNTEAMRIRSASGGPYTEPVADYWEKTAHDHPQYQVAMDNETDVNNDDEEYVLTNDDVNTFNDSEVYKSFNDDDMFSLKKIMGY